MDLFPAVDDGPQLAITPRPYQQEDHDECFRLWDSGVTGVLTRIFTGGGKSICACLKAMTWLEHSPEHRVLIVSYEKQLVWQFAAEVFDVMGISPGIEMERNRVEPEVIPRVVVASRQSLLVHPQPTEEQRQALAEFGVTGEMLGCCPKAKAERCLSALRAGADLDDVRCDLFVLNHQSEAANGRWSRLHKFDWRLPWLVILDEAHKHAYKLRSVRSLVDWFEQNPDHRRNGCTATPKRSDGVSLGDRMFPGVAIDYPLYNRHGRCAVRDGWAVPYVQRYINVQDVDFATIPKIAGDFDEHELARVLGKESTLASLVEPLLAMVDDRRTLIFSPSVEMAKNVAAYINARCPAQCPNTDCGKVGWYSRLLIGDGAQCECKTLICECDVLNRDDQAKAIWGEVPPVERREIYLGHQSGKFQFLSACGLCKEGYNDREISCVALFRPVSQAASSLSEQQRGRSCRPLKDTVEGLATAEERRAAIAASAKPNALIVDPVGATGLADCSTTLSIYAEGVEDVVRERAQEILLDAEEGMAIEDALDQAQEEVEAERVKARREAEARREQIEAELRAKAQAQVQWTAHEMGVGVNGNPGGATDKQIRYIESLGLSLQEVAISKRQAGALIDQLRRGVTVAEAAASLELLPNQWKPASPSPRQLNWLKWKRISAEGVRCRADASLLRQAHDEPAQFVRRKLREIGTARDHAELTALGREVGLARRVLPAADTNQLIAHGRRRREQLQRDF